MVWRGQMEAGKVGSMNYSSDVSEMLQKDPGFCAGHLFLGWAAK